MNFIYKNSRLLYYIKHFIEFARSPLDRLEKIQHDENLLTELQRRDIERRVNYYNQIDDASEIPDTASPMRLKIFARHKNYQIDLFKYARLFPKHLRIHRLFGDNSINPAYPTVLKSRPIHSGETQNGILMNLNKVRHFNFPPDRLSFGEKENRLVWRGAAWQQNRIDFLEQFRAHPKCDVGHYSKSQTAREGERSFLSIKSQFRYKFILSLEGNDVATNLKWILNSNSLCFMPTPLNETWFMEGCLSPGVHFVPVKRDFSDLEEKIDFYSGNAEAALQIISNAHKHVAQFSNPIVEDIIAFRVLKKYFIATRQLLY